MPLELARMAQCSAMPLGTAQEHLALCLYVLDARIGSLVGHGDHSRPGFSSIGKHLERSASIQLLQDHDYRAGSHEQRLWVQLPGEVQQLWAEVPALAGQVYVGQGGQ